MPTGYPLGVIVVILCVVLLKRLFRGADTPAIYRDGISVECPPVFEILFGRRILNFFQSGRHRFCMAAAKASLFS